MRILWSYYILPHFIDILGIFFFCKIMEDIEKGVDTTELWVERLRIAAVEHYSRHQVPQDILIQKKTAEYVKQTMGSSTTGHINGTGNTNNNNNGSTHSSSNGLDNEIRIPKIVDPVVSDN